MNIQVRDRILRSPWEPQLYNVSDLEGLLEISHPEATLIVASVNASDPSTYITHNDLVRYLKDFITITVIPQSAEEISAHGHWLLESGWGIDPARSIFRWIDPLDHAIRHTLTGALKVQLLRSMPIYDDDILDVTFEVRKS